jgi:hypothetical protein
MARDVWSMSSEWQEDCDADQKRSLHIAVVSGKKVALSKDEHQSGYHRQQITNASRSSDV